MLYFEASVAKRFHGNEKVELSERGGEYQSAICKSLPLQSSYSLGNVATIYERSACVPKVVPV